MTKTIQTPVTAALEQRKPDCLTVAFALSLIRPDCIDIAFALGQIQSDAAYLRDRFIGAAEDNRDSAEMVRENRLHLLEMQKAIAALVAVGE